jgi:membrane-bound serine protease (ClpP class)
VTDDRRAVKPGVAAATAFAVMLALAAALAATASAQSEEKIPSIELRGDLTPAAAAWIDHALGSAADAGAPFAIIRLDTPGGLESAAEDIVDQIRTAPMPVVVYVFPGGAEVENRGAAIVDAADVAAMAPGTTLESEGNDLGENTALKQGRIDTIAADQETLLAKLDGWEVAGPKEETLSTADEEIDDRSMTIPFQVLGVLVNPDVAVLLVFVGLLGLALEAFAPGTIIPGTLGAVALILGVIGAVQLPVAAIGVVLLVAAFGLILAATRMRPAAALGAFGVAALIGGGLLLFDTDSDQIAVSPAFVIAAGAVLGLATVLVGDRVLGPRRRPGIESEPEGAA